MSSAAAPAPAEPDRPQVEVVEAPSPSPDVEQLVAEPSPASPALVAANHAVVEAADAALAMPGVPGRDEFLSLAMQARILSMSAGAQKAIRDNPYLAFHVAMVGRDLGISPSAALELIDVIGEGDKVRLSLSPQLMNGQIRRLGLGSIVPAVKADDRCVVVVLGPGGRLDTRCRKSWPEHRFDGCTCTHDRILGDYEFTWADAQMAGLAGPDCQPGDHSAKCLDWKKPYCAQGYRTYPARMLWWRASGYAADDYFPEAGLGLYTAEELGAIVDDEGRPIDPTTVALPDGYEPKPREIPASEKPLAEQDPDAAADLRQRLDAIALVPDARAALAEKWQERNDDGIPFLPPFGALQLRHRTKARAVVKGAEDRIRRGEYGDDAKTAWETATEATKASQAETGTTPAPDDDAGAVEPQDAPEKPEGGDNAAADTEAVSGGDVQPEGNRDAGGTCLACFARPGEPCEHDQQTPNADDAQPVEDPPLEGDALAAAIVEEVKQLTPAAVLTHLRERGIEPEGSPKRHRELLAAALFDERQPR